MASTKKRGRPQHRGGRKARNAARAFRQRPPVPAPEVEVIDHLTVGANVRWTTGGSQSEQRKACGG